MSSLSRFSAGVACNILPRVSALFLLTLYRRLWVRNSTTTIGPPAKLAFTTQPGNVAAGSAIAAVAVSIEDANGNVVTSATNQVTIAIGTNPSSGTLTGTATATPTNGVATFSGLNINNAGTGYTLAASATGLTSATSNAFNVIGAATQLKFTVQPSNVAAGASITAAVAVSVEDALGNVVTTGAAATSQITIAIGTNPSSGTLSGTATVAAVAGVATFSTLSINKAGTGYTITASATNLTGATSSAFNVTVGAAAKLVFTTQPSNRVAGGTITAVLNIQDAQGNVVTTATNQVTIAIGTNPSSGALNGTKSLNAVAGVATFSGLSINSVGTGYTLTASATGLTGATSSAFNVAVGAEAKLAFTVQPSSVAASASISPAVVVSVQDAFGNLVATATDSITIAIGTNPSSGTLSGTTPVSAIAGVATFSNLSINNGGAGYTLIASATGLTGATSSTFNVFGGATQLAFTVQPSNVAVASSITPAVQVSVEDSNGIVVPSATTSITIAIGTNPATGALTGTSTASAVNGVATFSSLSITGSGAVGSGYTLTANGGGLTQATSTTFNVTAIVTDPCAAAGTGSESLLNGQYVWVTSGFDNESTPEPALVGGVLNFNGSGTINAAGTLDQNLNSTHGVQSLAITGGTYKVGTDHRACMDITVSQGTVHYRASLGNISSGVASTGHIINFDTAGPFTTGTLRKQSGTIPTTLSGAFAFEASAPQNTQNCNNSICGGKLAVGGVTTFSSNGSVTGEFDFNQNGQLDASNTLTAWPATAGSGFTGGTYAITGATGRGTVTFTPTGDSNPVHEVIYVVSASDVLLLDNDDQTSNSLFAGEALQQTGPFSATSLSGESVLYNTSIQINGGSPNTSSTQIAQLTSSSGTLSFSGWQVNGGAIAPQSKSGIAFTVGSDGRVVLTSGAGSNPPVFYLVGTNKAFFLGSSNGIETGVIEPQSSTSAPSGTFAFGTLEIDSITSANDGVAVFSGTPLAVSGTTDNNGSGGGQQANQTFSSQGVSVDSTGLGSISGGSGACTIGVTSASGCQLIFYVISPTRAVLMNLLNGQGVVSSNPTLQIADQ